MFGFGANGGRTANPQDQQDQNNQTKDGQDGWTDFPIGLCYKYIEYNGTTEAAQVGPHDNLVFCGIHPWNDIRRRPDGTDNRRKFLANLQNNGIENFFGLDPNAYFHTLPTYKFVVSPEGNGIDCHRHYEALMAGCIPIVEHNDKIKAKYEGCPILYTTDYTEITPEYLEQKYAEMIDKEYDFSSLFMSHYTPSQQEEIKQNGNHWVGCILHRSWY